MSIPGDRLRDGQQARTSTASLVFLRPNVPSDTVSGSYLPPGTHTFTAGEFFSGDTFYGPGGAYVYTFPFIDSSITGDIYSFPVPADATRWGRAQHIWLFRDNALPTSELDPYLPTQPYDAHSYWTADGDTVVAGTYTDSSHNWGRGAAYAVYVVVEIDDEHPAPEDPTIDLTDLMAFLQTLIAQPYVFNLRPTGMSEFEADILGNAYYVPCTGLPMTIQGFQVTAPATITVDGVEATDVVIHSYESDTGLTGFATHPGRVTFTAPPHEPAANDDEWVDVVVTCTNGVNVGEVSVQYVDPAQYTQLTSISPNRLYDTGQSSEFLLTGSNFEANGFWIAFVTDEQPFAGPYNAPVGFGHLFTSSISATEVHIPYPFTNGDDTYTLDPGQTYHVYVAGTYYRFADSVLRLTTGGSPDPDALYAGGDEGSPTDIGTDDGHMSVGTAVAFVTAGTVTGLQYFLPSSPAGNYYGALYQITAADTDPAGTLLGTLFFDTTGLSAQWITADFDETIDVLPETEAIYRAVVYSDFGVVSKTDEQFIGAVHRSAHGYVRAYSTGYTQPGLGVVYNGTYHSGAGMTYPSDADNHDVGVIVHGGDGYLVGVVFQPAGTSDKINVLLDNFGDPAVNTALWTISSGEPSQEASTLTVPPGAGMASVSSYDFTGSSIVLGVPRQVDIGGLSSISVGFGEHWLTFGSDGTSAITSSDLFDEIVTDGEGSELRWIKLSFDDDGALTVAVGANGFDDFATIGGPYPVTDDLTSTQLRVYADESGPTCYLDQIGPDD